VLSADDSEFSVLSHLRHFPLLVSLVIVSEGFLTETVHVRHFKDLSVKILLLSR